MRIVLVSANFRPHVGGIERFTENLALGLVRRGNPVRVVCCRHEGAPLREEVDGYSIARVPSSYILDRRLNVPWPTPSPASLIRILRRELAWADVVHVQDAIYATSVAALLIARRRGLASVLTQHVAFVRQRTPLLNGLEDVAIRTLGRSARNATRVACLNPAVASWTGSALGVMNAEVLPVGVEHNPPSGKLERADVRRSFGLPPARFLVLFVGRDVPVKGLDVFLGADDPAYDLVAVTDRSRNVVSAGVRLLPFMPHDRLLALLSCVDAFVLPSEHEGLSVAFQEALASGLPVVTTRLPAFEQYVSDEDVLYVDRTPEALRTAIRTLVTDEELRRRYSERALAAHERHFGIDAFVGAYEALYADALRAPRRSRSGP